MQGKVLYTQFYILQDVEPVDITAMEYAGDSTLYISTSNGKVSAWDTRHNTCFIHWEADNSEIGM